MDAEYILIEKASGVCLKTRWLELKDQEMEKLAYSFVKIEEKLFSFLFAATGSL